LWLNVFEAGLGPSLLLMLSKIKKECFCSIIFYWSHYWDLGCNGFVLFDLYQLLTDFIFFFKKEGMSQMV